MLNRLPAINYLKYYKRAVIKNTTLPYKFSHARTALKIGLNFLNLKPKDEVLIPELICDVVLQPFNELEILPIFYPVNEMLSPVWDEVEKKLTKNTKAIMMVHYFGQPNDIFAFEYFCRNNNIFLIEDNAHGHGGQFHRRDLGTFGDIGISSPRKSFPILNGGYLYVKNCYINGLHELKLEPTNIFLKQCKSLIKMAISCSPYVYRGFMKIFYTSFPSMFSEPHISEWGMDKESQDCLINQNFEHDRKRRQQIYNIWKSWAESQGLKPIFKVLDPGAIPLNFPAYISSEMKNIQWFEWGYKNGVDVHYWPNLPGELAGKESNILSLWERIICFPIHTLMNPEQIRSKLSHLSF